MVKTSSHIRRGHVPFAAVVLAVAVFVLMPPLPGLAGGLELDSREYKLMLKPENFTGADPRDAIDRFVRDELVPLVRAQWNTDAAERLQNKGLKLAKSRIVRFKDTANCLLSRSGLAWRERFKLDASGARSGEATGTLKFRSPDAFLAAGSRKSGGDDCKFEEDLTPVAIRTGPSKGVVADPRSVRSQFSQSCSREFATASLPGNLAAAAGLNPSFESGLHAAFSTADMSLQLVPGDEFLERVYERDELKLYGETEAEVALTIWYPAAGDHNKPFIAEISYKYDTKKHDVERETAQRALALLLKLQDSTWADPSALTKTSYAKCEESH
jgi:hypothetical protein